MPYGYLVSTVLLAVGTALSVAPIRRPGPLAALSFRVGLVMNESPLLALVLLTASTALAGAQHDLDTVAGRCVLGLAALTAVGLSIVVRRGRRAAPTIDAALATGLAVLGRPAFARPPGLRRRWPWARIVIGPWLVRRRDVERTAGLSYGPAGVRNQLDVYRHRSRPTDAPVFIHFHGGRFARGRKNTQSLPLLYRLASQGWTCISANYRLTPEVSFPGHLVDAKAVVAWAREHAAAIGADPGVIVVAGSSAGGHLAAMAAFTPNDPRFQPGFEAADTSVAAVVGLNGYYGPMSGPSPLASSPADYVTAGAPPCLIVHGDHDTLVPVEAVREFVETVRASSGAAVVYAELPGALHSFDLLHSIRFEAVIDGVETFLAAVRSRPGRPRPSGS